ncbi:FecR domain-containing protein [Luteimonas sp. BDR2-5]|uniref:FecR domain-containing protein n=1 Tax=Proluteimonas luteida TaxID=2878685 RepID=UPI001E2F3382|nr:FecR domain-containing protein [Luteimonas sp. BDR2-5]MCD9028074.1 FecR domain-containing protein [Luteimonas sp. BDR2-5]
MREYRESSPDCGDAAPPARPRSRRPGWCACGLLAALLLACGSVSAQDWHYRVRPGDTIWDLARTHLRPQVPWQDLQAHNAVDDPARLVPGSQLRIPVRWLRQQPAPATVVAVAGEATAALDAAARPVQAGMRLAAGTVLHTAADASLTLEFADGSQLQLYGDSELHLDRLSAYGRTGMVDTRLRLPRGRVGNSVQRSRGPASRFIVDTPGLMSSVRGTRFRVGSDGRLTRSEVLEGRVDVSGAGRQVPLRAGHGVAGDADGRPGDPRPLLPAPDVSAWPDLVERMPATVGWPAVAGATGYRVQVSDSPAFLTLLQDTATEAPEVRLSFHGEGALYARVRAIDPQGIEGADAERPLQVAAQPAPPFAVAPTQDAGVPGPRPRFRWTAAETPQTYRLQVAAGDDFATPLVDLSGLRRAEARSDAALAPGGYYWRVGASDDRGRDGPWGDPVAFTVSAPAQPPDIASDGPDGALQVRWQAGEEDTRYRFQLSRRADFATPTIDRIVDDNRIALPEVRSGTWYLRVQPLHGDGHVDDFGPTQTIELGCRSCKILAGAAALLLLAL